MSGWAHKARWRHCNGLPSRPGEEGEVVVTSLRRGPAGLEVRLFNPGEKTAHATLVVNGWPEANKSLMKASRGVQMLALHLATAMGSVKALSEVIQVIGRCIARRCRVEKRKKAPSSFQLLLDDALA